LVFAFRYDYSIFGPFMIFGLFLFQKNKWGILLILVSINFGICFFDSIASNSIELVQLFGILAFPLLIMPSSYGVSLKRVNKHVFYAFYPFHLMFIYLTKVSLL
ncbi:MAG: TraX family protein, partial [Promethearchaeota archaeon]